MSDPIEEVIDQLVGSSNVVSKFRKSAGNNYWSVCEIITTRNRRDEKFSSVSAPSPKIAALIITSEVWLHSQIRGEVLDFRKSLEFWKGKSFDELVELGRFDSVVSEPRALGFCDISGEAYVGIADDKTKAKEMASKSMDSYSG